MDLNDKIKFVIAERNLTPSHFADEIGVQRSSISHILSGRNRPSLEIVQRIVNRFPDLSYEWLLDDPGEAQPASRITQVTSERQIAPGLDTPSPDTPTTPAHTRRHDISSRGVQPLRSEKEQTPPVAHTLNSSGRPTIEKILIFYSDKTFTEYTPS